jgi:hypothetical protein
MVADDAQPGCAVLVNEGVDSSAGVVLALSISFLAQDALQVIGEGFGWVEPCHVACKQSLRIELQHVDGVADACGPHRSAAQQPKLEVDAVGLSGEPVGLVRVEHQGAVGPSRAVAEFNPA